MLAWEEDKDFILAMNDGCSPDSGIRMLRNTGSQMWYKKQMPAVTRLELDCLSPLQMVQDDNKCTAC